MMVIKVGGRFAENDTLLAALAEEIGTLKSQGSKIVLVHGGGTAISELQKRYGIQPRFIKGLRQTSPIEMPLVDMALAGAVNKHLVRLFNSRGLDSWGISGADAGTIIGEAAGKSSESNRTGRVQSVNTQSIRLLWRENFLPILAPCSMDSECRALNINADEAALALAESLGSEVLIFLSDVAGVLHQGSPIPRLSLKDMEDLIADGTISGGMIPKVKAAAGAMKSAKAAVFIAAYKNPGDLERILKGQSGTKLEV